MSVNKHRPHVMVLPEDDANRQIATGFHLRVDNSRERQMQVLPVAGGWNEVLNLFESQHVKMMERWPARVMILVIDFDDSLARRDVVRRKIPQHLADRVFVLGSQLDPERLKGDLGSYETIGAGLAKDCLEGNDTTWNHNLLRHNTTELNRLREIVRPILF